MYIATFQRDAYTTVAESSLPSACHWAVFYGCMNCHRRNAECRRSLLVVAVNPHEHTRTPRTQAKWRNERKRGVASGRRGAKRPRRGPYLHMAKLIAGLLLNKNRPILFLCNERARRWNGPKIYNNVILPL